MQLSQTGLAMLRSFEGCALKAYRDVAGVVTIGYGCTGPDVQMGQTITEAQANEMLAARLLTLQNGLARMVRVELTQSQWDGLVSFAYNVGLGALAKSTLLALVNAGNMAGAAAQFGRWVYVTVAGQKHQLQWQVKRRAAEARMFETGQWTPEPLNEA